MIKKLFLTLSLALALMLIWGQGMENFENLPTTGSGSYLARTWTGTDGVTWTAEGARTDQTLDGKAICFGNTSHGNRWVTSPSYSGGMGTLTFKYVRGFTGNGVRTIQVIVNGSQIGGDISVSNASDVIIDYNEAINVAGDVVLQIKSIGAAQVLIDNISWTAFSGAPSPTITINPATLTGFSYVHNNGPSAEQAFTLTGANLITGVGITAPAHYEISKTTGSGFSASLDYSIAEAEAGQTVYVRLKAGLTLGSYNGETITLSTTDADNKTVTCSGSVDKPLPPAAPVATDATDVTHQSFNAHWDSVAGAEGYMLSVYTKTAGTNATDLFISEYVEGSSNNKALEIFNGTGATVDLSQYRVSLYSNGAAAPSNSLVLSGNLNDGAVLVMAHSSADAAILAKADITNNAVINFNGDDAIALQKWDGDDWNNIDIFGMIGQQPNKEWLDGAHSTLDKTLVRKATVLQGVSVNPSGYEAGDKTAFETLASEWDVYPNNTFDYLGSHTMAGGTTLEYVFGYESQNVYNLTSHEIFGLVPNTEYYYAVKAYDAYDQFSPLSNEIMVTTQLDEIIVSADGYVSGGEMDLGGDIPAALLGPDTGIPALVFTINSTGVKDVTIHRPVGFGSIDWYCWLSTPGTLYAATNPISALNIFYKFENVDFDAKGDVVVIINDNSTLPIELSSFTATLNAQNYVQLTWITQSETGVQGFYIYRGTDSNLSTAILVSNLIEATNSSQSQTYKFVDTELDTDGLYYYWLQSSDLDGSSVYHGPVTIQFSYDEEGPSAPELPFQTRLKAVYPNPFNPNTRIPYELAKSSNVDIKIYNTRGQLVKSYPIGSKQAGEHHIDWDGKNDRGEAISSGIYFIKMQAGTKSYSSKAILLK